MIINGEKSASPVITTLRRLGAWSRSDGMILIVISRWFQAICRWRIAWHDKDMGWKRNHSIMAYGMISRIRSELWRSSTYQGSRHHSLMNVMATWVISLVQPRSSGLTGQSYGFAEHFHLGPVGMFELTRICYTKTPCMTPRMLGMMKWHDEQSNQYGPANIDDITESYVLSAFN